jgi:hypothetical protein
MERRIKKYLLEEDGKIIIDKSIIGKTVLSADGSTASVLNAGYDASGAYITVKGGEHGYKIPETLFKLFRLID